MKKYPLFKWDLLWACCIMVAAYGFVMLISAVKYEHKSSDYCDDPAFDASYRIGACSGGSPRYESWRDKVAK